MTEAFDVAAGIATAISGVISILSVIMSKRNNISLEKIKNDLEIKKMSKLHVEIMNMKLVNGYIKNANQSFFNLPNCLKVQFWSHHNKERRLHRTKMDKKEKGVYQATYCSGC